MEPLEGIFKSGSMFPQYFIKAMFGAATAAANVFPIYK
jgi:hypothetical protein